METTDDDIRLVTLEEFFACDTSVGSLSDLPCGWQALRQTPSADWQRQQMPRGDMFYFRFDAVPTQENPEFEAIGGASICCWIVADSVESAEMRVREEIQNSHWFIKKLEETLETGTHYYSKDDDDALQFVRQAEIDGEVFVFITHPAHEGETENGS